MNSITETCSIACVPAHHYPPCPLSGASVAQEAETRSTSCAHSFGEWCSGCIDGMVQQYNTVRKENWALQADLSSLRSEVERLKGELDACETHVKIQARAIEEHHAKADAEVERLTQERDALALQVGQLREALADCGIHSVRCRTRKTLLAEDCNCGLSAALASSPTAPATPETNK